MSLPVLNDFPNTIANLPDRPNLSAQRMKEALQADPKELWEFVQDLVAFLSTSAMSATLPLSVANGGTGTTTPAGGRTNLGIHVGNVTPSSIAGTLNTGDIYIYVPTLP